MYDVYIRFIPLPISVEGSVLPNEDMTFDIYINANLCSEKQKAVLEHELKHIKNDHLWDLRPVYIIEGEAG